MSATTYTKGARFEVTGAEIQADNGTFEIVCTFPTQPDGDDHFVWSRVMKNGEVSKSRSTNALRGGRASWLDRHARIISQPK
jgi:hypothetical protein